MACEGCRRRREAMLAAARKLLGKRDDEPVTITFPIRKRQPVAVSVARKGKPDGKS
jgi:hypothetical protein